MSLPTDIAILTVIPAEFLEVRKLLENPTLAQGTSPNLYGYEHAIVRRTSGGEYRVVLGLAGKAGTANCSQAIIHTVEQYSPRYVLLLGIAGCLAPDEAGLGDVILSSEVFGYEYGKVDDGFKPRPNWTYRPDGALFNSAQRFAAIDDSWYLAPAPYDTERKPKVIVGGVASGEKVVDNPDEPFFRAVRHAFPSLKAVEMEGLGAASAIEHLVARGRTVGFLMIRGFSDVPKGKNSEQPTPADDPTNEGAPEKPGGGPKATLQTQQRDANKPRAAWAAAAFAVKWIADGWPVAPYDTAASPSLASAPAATYPASAGASAVPQPSPPTTPLSPGPLSGATESVAVPVASPAKTLPAYRPEESCAFFHDRMCDAFPGLSGGELIASGEAAVARLRVLLRSPLGREGGSPIWEVGRGTASIDMFKVAEGNVVYFNETRYKVRGLFGYRSSSYWRDFAILYWEAEPGCGIYPNPPPPDPDRARDYGPRTEEYGIAGKVLVTRAEHDDGSKVIDGKPKRLKSRLEVRFVDPGATFLVAQRSPVNDIAFDRVRLKLMPTLETKDAFSEEIAALVEKLPKHRREDH